jgi:hypothetical protein
VWDIWLWAVFSEWLAWNSCLSVDEAALLLNTGLAIGIATATVTLLTLADLLLGLPPWVHHCFQGPVICKAIWRMLEWLVWLNDSFINWRTGGDSID